MKSLFAVSTVLFLVAALALAGCGGDEAAKDGNGAATNGGGTAAAPDPTPAAGEPLEEGVYPVGCMGCVFEDERASGCQTAVKVGDELYFARGPDVPNAHSTGLCEGEKTATVAGQIRGDTIYASTFEVEE